MSFSGFSFIFWRIMQIITLIPTMGMLAYFIDLYEKAQIEPPRRAPDAILILFIVSTLAVAWTIGTLFLYARAKHSAGFVAFVDLLFVGAFIGAVYTMRSITDTDCTSVRAGDPFLADFGYFQFSGSRLEININKECAMLKACFAFGIMNCIFFFITFLLALLVHRHYGSGDRVVVKRETHYSRHGHRSHRSRSPRHSHHSRRSYV